MSRLISKQYAVVAAAATAGRPIPAVPNRKSLFIQNTGANPGFVRLGGSVLLDGGDILFAAGVAILWDNPETTPNEDVNVFSTLGTTFCIIEGIG